MQNCSSGERRTSVLVVDDQPDVADTGADILALSGYDTKIAYSAAEALAVLAEGDTIDVLFLDIGMRGGMSGLDLAVMARDRFPAVAVLLTTGHGDALASAKSMGFEVLPKPYSVDSLRNALGRLRSLDH